MWVIVWLIVALASLVALFLLVLSVPLDLAFHLDVHGRTRFSLKLVWLFGLVGKELGRRKKKAKPKKDKEKKGGARKALKFLRTKGLLRQIKILVTDVFNSLSIRQLNANFKIGLDNSMDTSLLLGIIESLRLFWRPSFPNEIDIRADYGGEVVLEGHMQAVVRLLPIRLVIPLLKFVFSFPTLRIIKTAVSAKWKKKR